MSARKAWPQCLPVLLLDSNGLGGFLSREMHKWKFLTPQRRLGLCGATLEKPASLPRRQTHWVLQDKELRGGKSAGASLCFGHQADTHMYTHVYSCTCIQYRAHIHMHTHKHHKDWNGTLQLCQIPVNTIWSKEANMSEIYHYNHIVFQIWWVNWQQILLIPAVQPSHRWKSNSLFK